MNHVVAVQLHELIAVEIDHCLAIAPLFVQGSGFTEQVAAGPPHDKRELLDSIDFARTVLGRDRCTRRA